MAASPPPRGGPGPPVNLSSSVSEANSGSGPGPRVSFAAEEAPDRRRGRVTVRYDRRELRKRLQLEEWILAQLTVLYDCREEEIPELEIDVDELLELESDGARSAHIQDLLVDCYKPTEVFIQGLLEKIRGMQKLTPPRKNDPPIILGEPPPQH